MRAAPLFLLVVLILVMATGCSFLPEATGQLRITEHGERAGYPLIGGGEVGGCIVSVVGTLPAGLLVAYDGERCRVRYGGQATL